MTPVKAKEISTINVKQLKGLFLDDDRSVKSYTDGDWSNQIRIKKK
jgi:hypothetical protein